MKQCLHITFKLNKPKTFLTSVVQKSARSLSIEGTAQLLPVAKHVKVIACGLRDNVDEFLDTLHNEMARDSISELEIQPTLKERDFRGVFRVIE